MSKIRLLLVLRSLDEYEFKKFEEMVYSPYFNKVKNCIKLFELLKPYYPHFKDEGLTKEFLFFKLFPEKKKMTSSINIYLSQLQNLAEEHLTLQELNKRFLYKKNLLLNVHLEKGLHKQFQSEYKETMKRFSNINKRDSTHYLEQFLIENSYRNFQKSTKGRNQLFPPKLTMNFLDSYYYIQKLTFACEERTYSTLSSTDKPIAIKELLVPVKQGEDFVFQINKKYPQSHVSLLFQMLLDCLEQPENETIFDRFLELLLKTDIKTVVKKEFNEFFVHSINYCILKIVEGKLSYKTKLFELYKLIVDFELIYEIGYLNLNRVKNIISCAIQVGELEWAMQFLENYKGEIHPNQYNSVYPYFLASIYFYSKQYDKAIEYLSMVERYVDKYYFLDGTTLLLRCYYEGKETLAFENACRTFRVNIERNKKLSTKEKSSYGTFTRIANFLYQHRAGFSKKTKSNLLKLINNSKYIVNKQWLLEKHKELKS